MSIRHPPHDDPRTLVSTGWLAQHLNDPDLRILDASWYLPDAGRDGHAEYLSGHIPGARFFDIDEICDQRSPLPHMAPPPEKFASRLRAMGVGDGHQVVVYDADSLFAAARVWWLFRLMGKRDVAVLDGGFRKWCAEGRPTEDLPPVVRDRHMTVSRQNQLVRDVTQVARAVKLGEATLIDTRSAERFRGDAPEPRPGLRAGHVPGARNLPARDLLREDGTMKDADSLAALFAACGISTVRPVITMCGSGVTASAAALALERIGRRDWSVYDGSWAEWGMYGDLPVETGPARGQNDA